MAVAGPVQPRVSVAGKFFRLGEKRFFAKGVACGPFPPTPGQTDSGFASPEQTARDFARIQELGANLVRVYSVPKQWYLDLAAEHGLKVLVDVVWNQQVCFLDSAGSREQARQAVRSAVVLCQGHPAVFAFSVANEISPDIVRWSGASAVADFLDELVGEAKRIDRDCLCTYTNFPPTEFLRPLTLDFTCFNLYLHQERAWQNYLARLQMLAESKPLLLGEVGVDSLREGEPRKCEMLSWQLEAAYRGGLAGAVVFSFTDDWWKDGQPVLDWQMGLTTRERQPKDSFYAVQRAFRNAPHFPLARYPRVSVVVACYNGERTLNACLTSLEALNYPDYEIILVDDGSSDTTPQIARQHPKVRCFRHQQNRGLSAARNTGIAMATGEIIAFTDADCRADEDWLYYLAGGLVNGEYAGMGGPNLPPPEDSVVAAAVAAAPGGPAHVMLTDRQAEHIPGCNMAFFKRALDDIERFDPVFRKAGDDVDLCWRLQQAGCKIGFSPAAFVWHYRRSTVSAYLRQQHGYGEAEALLVRKHPECFSWFGGSIWRGRIYAPASSVVRLQPAVIYHGLFGSAGCQSLYASEPALSLMLCTALEYHLLVTLPLWILALIFPGLLPLAVTSLLLSLGVCVAAGTQARLPKSRKRPWSRPLVAWLFFLQPIVRGWARYRGRLLLRAPRPATRESLDSLALRDSEQKLHRAEYWGAQPVNRFAYVGSLLRALEQQGWAVRSDIGWCDYDAEIDASRWTRLQLTTVLEAHAKDRHLLRCRLRPRMSLPAKVVLFSAAALEFIVLGLTASATAWLWLLLLSLPLLGWLLRRDRRALQSRIILLLDEVGSAWRLQRTSPSLAAPSRQAGVAEPAPAGPFSEKARAPDERIITLEPPKQAKI